MLQKGSLQLGKALWSTSFFPSLELSIPHKPARSFQIQCSRSGRRRKGCRNILTWGILSWWPSMSVLWAWQGFKVDPSFNECSCEFLTDSPFSRCLFSQTHLTWWMKLSSSWLLWTPSPHHWHSEVHPQLSSTPIPPCRVQGSSLMQKSYIRLTGNLYTSFDLMTFWSTVISQTIDFFS